jgi:glycosyltransferase involved in cell wall biosynthesis
VNNETLSIEDVRRIRKPMVWTFQDMWAFCGAEHVSQDRRFVEGYGRDNRPASDTGVDLDRWAWERKRRSWDKPIHIVAPSHWMADCVRQSALMRDWPVTVIANPVDTDNWAPVEKKVARKLLHLPEDVPLLLFGTSGANDSPHKGFDLLLAALECLRGKVNLHLVIFGQIAPKNPVEMGFPVHYMGHLHDDLSMRVAYSAADAVAIPSRVDNLPNVGIEAISCATPVVAFDVCGLPDIVRHRETGYLAEAFDPEDFARGLIWMFEDKQRHEQLCINARQDAVERFSYAVIAKKYSDLYQHVLSGHSN